jgi:hypothetical protein
MNSIHVVLLKKIPHFSFWKDVLLMLTVGENTKFRGN